MLIALSVVLYGRTSDSELQVRLPPIISMYFSHTDADIALLQLGVNSGQQSTHPFCSHDPNADLSSMYTTDSIYVRGESLKYALLRAYVHPRILHIL